MPNEPINIIEPIEKLKENFCGCTAMVGRPTKNASAKKRADKKSKPQNTFVKKISAQ